MLLELVLLLLALLLVSVLLVIRINTIIINITLGSGIILMLEIQMNQFFDQILVNFNR